MAFSSKIYGRILGDLDLFRRLRWKVAVAGLGSLVSLRQFRFEFGNPLLERGDQFFDFRKRVARRDVLRAVPVKRFDFNKE